MKKAAVFDPYLDIIGGGEVYTCNVIEFLLTNKYSVDIFWQNEALKGSIKKYLGIDLSETKINQRGFWLYKKKGNILGKINETSNYDFVFYLSDGSIPWLFAKNNLIHFQIPFTNVNGKSFINRLKFRKINQIVSNSYFTKRFIDREFNINSKVIYPPVSVTPPKEKKENTILSVGRFTSTLHNKRQDVLVNAFKSVFDCGYKDWKLKLIGNAKEGETMIHKLKSKIKRYPVEIITDIAHVELEHEYSKAKIFWHAAGYGINEAEHPELVEHFGIATAEAMASGCVPIAINKGGQKEIVENNISGLLWESAEELSSSTVELIKNPAQLEKLSNQAKKRSQIFSKERFHKNLEKVIP